MKCEYCGAEFESIYDTKKYCSRKCKQAAKDKRKRIKLGIKPRQKGKEKKPKWTPQNLLCDWCGEKFTQKTTTQHFCSRECRIQSHNKKVSEIRNSDLQAQHCKYCDEIFMPYRHGMLFCCKSCSDKYAWHKMNKMQWDSHLKSEGMNINDGKAVFHMQDIQSYFDKNNVPFDYVSGWINTGNPAMIRCRKCGNIYSSGMENIRKGRCTPCPVCLERESRERLEDIAQKKKLENEKKQEIRRQKKEQQILARESKKRTVKCDICGCLFITYKSNVKSCSAECAKKRQNRYADKRLTKDNIIDRDINLKSLYERDNGICYLCGKPCDWSDIHERNGTQIAGGTYPSIDHVVALANGGKHSWKNVKLAHRQCNTLKRDNYLTKFYGKYEQYSLF